MSVSATAVACATILSSTACSGAQGDRSHRPPHTVNVLMVDNPQMLDLERLTATYFTKATGIKVNFTVLPEDHLRDEGNKDFSRQSGRYDVASLSNYEVPIYAKAGWLAPLTGYAADDRSFDQNDILAPMEESLTVSRQVYAEPFYGESSFLMYRKDLLAAKNLAMPAHPTWAQVASMAARLDGAAPGMKGICLRGQPGWGEVIAPLTTVVNTFGGTWFAADWNAELTSDPFKQATRFYVDLVRQHGEAKAAQAGYSECLNDMEHGRTAMWYDSTAAAGTLEQSDSPVKGDIGYAPAPVEDTTDSGWIYTWAWAVEKASQRRDDAWKFISWASSKGYENLVGNTLGWSRVPAGKRGSTYRNSQYAQVAAAFANATLNAINTVNPDFAGIQPRPTTGVQFVDIPEFSGLGDEVSQRISAAIAGRMSVDDALQQSQELAERISTKYTGSG
ncbi:ABC transporter substrate-binding protein [Streptantibioticus ferralitis]|uniref:Sugar ABC transporter substrate-binding protein n=1 Tax=Streptantibioticus ferralitis TaxID=236510 RepID=A0ABT5YSZ5_9ACTN|nr:sugar ABC transporter substrate-binding protein [Streptantibioticus ferralitis]MDF2254723.1 sugar ABC transporter substrate-binding protein [Streptantibioticus ferralitis]